MIRQEGFETRKERDHFAKVAKADGYSVRKWNMPNQEVGYNGFGSIRDTRRRTVYMVDTEE